MSEKEPIEIENAYYYLRLASNGLHPIFSEQAECDLMLNVLQRLYSDTGTATVAYCLLQDCVHLVIHVDKLLSEQVADWVINAYTNEYNARHNRNGSVFDDSLVSTLIEPSRYLLAVVAKTHSAPVDSGLVAHAAAYPWSSHRSYLKPEPPKWLQRDAALRYSAGIQSSRYRRFQDFVERTPQRDTDLVNGNHPQYYALASDSYIQKRLEPNNHKKRRKPSISLESLSRWVCKEYRIQPSDLLLRRHHRLGVEVKGVIAYLAARYSVSSLEMLANELKIDQELLQSSMKATELHRGMFLHKLSLQLDNKLAAFNTTSANSEEAHDDERALTAAPEDAISAPESPEPKQAASEPAVVAVTAKPIDSYQQPPDTLAMLTEEAQSELPPPNIVC